MALANWLYRIHFPVNISLYRIDLPTHVSLHQIHYRYMFRFTELAHRCIHSFSKLAYRIGLAMQIWLCRIGFSIQRSKPTFRHSNSNLHTSIQTYVRSKPILFNTLCLCRITKEWLPSCQCVFQARAIDSNRFGLSQRSGDYCYEDSDWCGLARHGKAW